MNIIPAIDLIGGKAVRLQKGDYAKVTVYSDSPCDVAKSFQASGAKYLHIVDLDGAKSGRADNIETIREIIRSAQMSVEVGGGIRNIETVALYADAGVDRIILGTAAVKDPAFLREAVARYGEKIAVGVDIKDGMVAIKGWTEVSQTSCEELCEELCEIGVRYVICTDISKDGMMSGTNLELYSTLSERFDLDFIASGGVSSLDDIKALSKMKLFGAILGKALYTGAIDLATAIKTAEA